jgi:hypothetical protein
MIELLLDEDDVVFRWGEWSAGLTDGLEEDFDDARSTLQT